MHDQPHMMDEPEIVLSTSDVGEEKPVPSYPPVDFKTIFLGGIFILALLTAFYLTAPILLPIILAIVLKLVLRPVMRLLEKLHIPCQIGAVLIICLLFGSCYGLGTVLSGPAEHWAQQLPDMIAKVQGRLHVLVEPIKQTQNVIQNAEGLALPTNSKTMTVAIAGSGLSDRLLTHTQSLVSGVGETILVLFFLLAAGDTFLRRFIEILPRFQDKRSAVSISQQIESDISAYLATITFMNVCVGVATGTMMWLYGIADPILWGTLAFLLNYVPILGPITAMALFAMAGVITKGAEPAALIPPGLYILINLTESIAVTPMLLSKRFTLNPVLVILGVIFWYWMWGVTGAILATPMLAVTKIICARIQPLMPFGHFIEG